MPWRLRWNGSLGHVGYAGSLHSPLAQPAVEQSARDADGAATIAHSAAPPMKINESVLSGDVEGVVCREGIKHGRVLDPDHLLLHLQPWLN